MPGCGCNLRARLGEITKKTSYDDVEGIVMTLGVIGALMIAFSIGLSYMLFPNEVVSANFPAMMCSNPSFRTYVLHVMDTWDIGTHAPETFNFTKPMGADGVLDIKGVLAASHGEFDGDKCKSSDVQASIAFLLEEFPMQFFKAWVQKHPKDPPKMINVQFSSHLGTVLLFMSTGSSLVAYISLAVSPAREDSSGKVMLAWLTYGKYALLFTVGMMLAGLVCFFHANDEFLKNMMNHKYWYDKDVILDIIFGGAFVLTIVLVVAADVNSCGRLNDDTVTSVRDVPVSDPLVFGAEGSPEDAIVPNAGGLNSMDPMVIGAQQSPEQAGP